MSPNKIFYNVEKKGDDNDDGMSCFRSISAHKLNFRIIGLLGASLYELS
jgi:hypothetical protein